MKTVLITGVSSGLGRSIALEALSRGHRVIGTLRREDQRAEFDTLAPGRSFGRILDITQTDTIQPFVAAIESDFGAIDVLINNAGFGQFGTVEELDLDALRRQFEVNVFAQIAVIQAVLPAMRGRGRGLIMNMVSMGGIITFAGLGAYHGSKFAILGLNDALAKEVAHLGIKVTAIMPGYYRSDFSTRSNGQTERRIPDYDPLFAENAEIPWGDADALGRVVVTALEMDEPPAHLLVGPHALANVRERLAQWTAEIDRWEELSHADGEG